MKKLAFLLLIAFLTPSLPSISVKAEETLTYYAKVLNQANFYSSASESSPLFTLPNTYFVLLIGQEGDFYRAKYLDLYGYVKKDEVTPMDGVPTSPYPNEVFRNFNDNGLNLQSQPTNSSATLGKLDFLEEYTLYGTTTGQEPFPNSTNVWYYCNATINGVSTFGYAFSYYCDIFDGFTENTEYFPAITGELQFSSQTPENGGLSDTVIAIIILAVSLPCLVILYLLLSPSKKLKTSQRRIFSRKGHKDYYEFNEDDL